MTFISYAQTYEDVMLARAFRGVAQGFYIDVGAQDPRMDSVTKAFYDQGWHGINLEPVAHWHRRLVEERPRDTNLCLAAGDHEGSITLHETEESGLSTVDAAIAARHRAEGVALRAREVPMQTLDAICREQGVGEVHFLKVDVEGAEAEVLRGLDLSRVRPWVILVEATAPNSRTSTHEQWESLVTAHGYRLVYRDGLNRFYLATEHEDLAPAFDVPPNIFDDFIRREQHDLGEILGAQVRQLDAHAAALKDLSDRRGELIDRLEADVSERDGQVRQLLEYQHAAEAHQGVLRTELARREAEVAELNALAARQQEQAAQLNALAARQQEQVERFAERHAADLQALRELAELQQARLAMIEGLQGELAAAQETLAAREATLAARQATLARTEAELARTSRLLLDAEAGRLTALARLEASQQAYAISQQELARQQAEMQVLVNSRSWRITAPLRRINAWLAHLRERLRVARQARRAAPPASAAAADAGQVQDPPETRLALTADAAWVLARFPVQPAAPAQDEAP